MHFWAQLFDSLLCVHTLIYVFTFAPMLCAVAQVLSCLIVILLLGYVKPQSRAVGL